MLPSRSGHGPAGGGPRAAGEATRANDLYWRSEASVNRLARDLKLSKGALYQIIAPLPAGLRCPRCRAEMGYPNRTARERGIASCGACRFEDEAGRAGSREPREADGGDSAIEVAPGVPGLERAAQASTQETTPPDAGRSLAMLLVVAAFAGAALGFLLSAAAKKR